MKLNILTTAAAVLVAGIAGFNAITDASAATFPKFKLKIGCTNVSGGNIAKPGISSSSGWKGGLCVSHFISSNLAVNAQGGANFNIFKNLKASSVNIAKCAKSVVIVRFYKSTFQGTWAKLATKKAKAAPQISGGVIKKCSAHAGVNGFVQGSGFYRTVIMAVDGKGNQVKGITRSSVMTTQSNLF